MGAAGPQRDRRDTLALDNVYYLRKPRSPAEYVFFEDERVRVTRSALTVDSRRHALASIESVTLGQRRRARTVPVALIAVGALGAFLSIRSRIFVGLGAMLLLVAAGVGPLLFDEANAVVELHTEDGVLEAFESADRALVGRIAEALNEALHTRRAAAWPR